MSSMVGKGNFEHKLYQHLICEKLKKDGSTAKIEGRMENQQKAVDVLLPIIVSGTASLITSGIHGIGEGILSLLKPLSMRGEARLEGLVRLCLYLVSITLLVRFLFGR